ncbi:hypothetical protein NE857_09610 [Nocardiopsis exhalans]|uniref:DUF7683 domain-containing protein n=1 Tax=Nocardiopsis exhalans TaxID=163604 RepID=A0ABY5DFF6_9ACTN|nr:hypothetical protein [Nocardiopsis exhalans]USY21836.1 hypothetical protein NE857_09610 [Nocardiopsis exhalans]
MVIEWVLDEFDRDSERYLGHYVLPGLSHAEVSSWVGANDVEGGGVFDVPDSALAEISERFGLKTSPEKCEYLIGEGTITST